MSQFAQRTYLWSHSSVTQSAALYFAVTCWRVVLRGNPTLTRNSDFLLTVVLDLIDALTICDIVLIWVCASEDLVPFIFDPILNVASELHVRDVLQVAEVPCLVGSVSMSRSKHATIALSQPDMACGVRVKELTHVKIQSITKPEVHAILSPCILTSSAQGPDRISNQGFIVVKFSINLWV